MVARSSSSSLYIYYSSVNTPYIITSRTTLELSHRRFPSWFSPETSQTLINMQPIKILLISLAGCVGIEAAVIAARETVYSTITDVTTFSRQNGLLETLTVSNIEAFTKQPVTMSNLGLTTTAASGSFTNADSNRYRISQRVQHHNQTVHPLSPLCRLNRNEIWRSSHNPSEAAPGPSTPRIHSDGV